MTFERRPTSADQDEYGQPVTAWVEVAKAWASIEPETGRELLAADAVQNERRSIVTINHVAGLTAEMRMVSKGRAYNIISVVNVDERDRDMQLLVSEGLSNG